MSIYNLYIMKQNNVYCFALYLKTVYCAFSILQEPSCWNIQIMFVFFFFLKKLFKQALICEDPSDKREQRLWKGVCGGATFQNFPLHHLSHHVELLSSL